MSPSVSRTRALALVVCVLLTPAGAQKKFSLTIENIMRGPELYGYEPRAVRWSGDSQRIFFQWKQASENWRKEYDTYVINRDGSGLRKLSDEEAKLAPPLNPDYSRDRKRAVYGSEGDLFLYDYTTDKVRRLTKTTDMEGNPRFTRDEKRVTFTRGGNLYSMSLENGLVEQYTDIRTGGAGPAAAPTPMLGGGGFGQGRGGGAQAALAALSSDDERKGTDSQEFIKKEERDLLETVKDRARKREEDEARRKRENPRKPFRLAPRQNAANLQLSPDEKYVVATVMESGEGSKNTIVPNFVTESGYTEDINSRSKVGDSQSRMRMAVIRVDTGEVKWADHGLKEPAPPRPAPAKPAGDNAPAADAAAPQPQRRAPDPAKPMMQERSMSLFPPVWSEDGSKAIVRGRSGDNKDQWIFALDLETGKLRTIVTQHDDAWIGGPGSFVAGWLKDNRTIYYQSERDGYSHLYTVPFEGGTPTQLTQGKWEVASVRLSNDGSKFYLTTGEASPFERHLYSMNVDGGERTKITSMTGSNEAVLSPDETQLATIYSYTNKPPELYSQSNQPGAGAKKLTSSPSPEFWDYAWQDVPIVKIPARDGIEVPAQLYKPSNFPKGGPAVIFVHGAGYLQNVHKWWSSYAHEYMFQHILMENGYLVLNVDYRGSAGYGRDWRTAIYRHMGGKDLDDQVDAAKWLVAQHGVDPKRIGLYGGSYGGFITLMALFTQPDVFAAGAALRPVTDWAHYNHGYTSNILNVPYKDVEAYRQSGPIYFANGLKGALLICHGMVDTNVHFQDTVRLVQKLIELKKENWQLAVYPVEDHGFQEPASWTDEYRRIFGLFEKNLKPAAGPSSPGPARKSRKG